MLTSRGLHVFSKIVNEYGQEIPQSQTADFVLKAEPGKLDIKRREPGILFISLPIVEHSSN